MVTKVPRSPHDNAGRARIALALAATTLLGLACAGGSTARNETPIVTEDLSVAERAAFSVVAGLQDAMIAIMQQGPDLGYAGRYAALDVVARRSFDIPGMARASFGPGFVALTPEQQQTWIDVYERFHISSLADVRDKYSGQIYIILDASEPKPGIVMIGSKLDYPGRNVDLYSNYRLRSTAQGWRIIDVYDPPSVSEVAMRRSEYRTVLERSGFDGLLEEMESRIRRRERP